MKWYLMTLVAFITGCVMIGIFHAVLYCAVKLKRWHRRRESDRRIIRQAKAAGVWDKYPIFLGGRALELKAWKTCRIKRRPGEKDAQLRSRLFRAAWHSGKVKSLNIDVQKSRMYLADEKARADLPDLTKATVEPQAEELENFRKKVRKMVCGIFQLPEELFIYDENKTAEKAGRKKRHK